MTPQQMLDLVKLYENKVSEAIKVVETPQLAHLITMFPEMIVFAEKSLYLAEPEKSKYWQKVNRWLGFVQGVLWTNGIFTIEEMCDHNRSKS
jgi:hypothetical protein